MKFYSDKTKKLYETEDELKAAEAELQELTDSRELTKKQLAKKVEAARDREKLAEEAYSKTEKQVEELIENTKKQIDELYDKPTKELREAQEEKLKAIREFNEKFGAYTVSYSAEEIDKEFNRLLKSITNWDIFKHNLFRPWIF